MQNSFIAKATIKIKAPVSKVWDALVKPDLIKQYMFGTNVESKWKEGSQILWKGEWQGKTYEDKGTILELKPNEKLQYTHFSPLTGQPDTPENYHTVTVALREEDKQTVLTLSQDNNATEESKKHSENNWEMMLDSLKKLLEM